MDPVDHVNIFRGMMQWAITRVNILCRSKNPERVYIQMVRRLSCGKHNKFFGLEKEILSPTLWKCKGEERYRFAFHGQAKWRHTLKLHD